MDASIQMGMEVRQFPVTSVHGRSLPWLTNHPCHPSTPTESESIDHVPDGGFPESDWGCHIVGPTASRYFLTITTKPLEVRSARKASGATMRCCSITGP